MKKVNYIILDPRGFLEFKNDNRIIDEVLDFDKQDIIFYN